MKKVNKGIKFFLPLFILCSGIVLLTGCGDNEDADNGPSGKEIVMEIATGYFEAINKGDYSDAILAQYTDVDMSSEIAKDTQISFWKLKNQSFWIADGLRFLDGEPLIKINEHIIKLSDDRYQFAVNVVYNNWSSGRWVINLIKIKGE